MMGEIFMHGGMHRVCTDCAQACAGAVHRVVQLAHHERLDSLP